MCIEIKRLRPYGVWTLSRNCVHYLNAFAHPEQDNEDGLNWCWWIKMASICLSTVPCTHEVVKIVVLLAQWRCFCVTCCRLRCLLISACWLLHSQRTRASSNYVTKCLIYSAQNVSPSRRVGSSLILVWGKIFPSSCLLSLLSLSV